MSQLTFDRWDFLGTRVVLGVIALAVTGFGVIGPVIEWLRGQPLTWQLQTGKTDEVVTDQFVARPGTELTSPGTADVSIEAQQPFALDLGQTLMVAAAGLVCAALAEAFAHGIRLADDVEGLV